MRKVIIGICGIVIIMGLILFSGNTPYKIFKSGIEGKYSEVKSVTTLNVGPTFSIRYHIKQGTPFEICESVFYDTINMIKEDELYHYLFKVHGINAGLDIGAFKVEFTTKDESKPRYGLICEFVLVGSAPSTAEVYEWDEAVWECVDSSYLLVGKYKYLQKGVE